MKDDVSVRYNVNRTNRFIVIITLVISTLLSVQAFIALGFSYGIKVILCTYSSALAGAIASFLSKKSKRFDTISPLIITMSVAIAAAVLSYLQRGFNALTTFIIYLSSIAMISMYFRVKLLVIHGILINIMLIFFFIIDPVGVLGAEHSIPTFMRTMFTFNFSLTVFYFLTKWGNEYTLSAIRKEQEAKGLLTQLENTLKAIDDDTAILSSSIEESFVLIKNIEQMSDQTRSAIEEMAKGVSENAASTERIVSSANDATKIVEETRILSRDTKAHSGNMKNIIEENSKGIDQMVQQMDTIDKAVGVSLTNISELKLSMEKINESLSDITAIANQTNLLALNASIEAARAGEQGKGFTVVASEIGKLAEMSNRTVKKIVEIIEEIIIATNSTHEKVLGGKEAVNLGNKFISNVKNSFDNLEHSLEAIVDGVEKEDGLINDISSSFDAIMEQLESISAVSEEHAASTEEVLAAIETQFDHISKVTHEMSLINEQSNNLRKVLN